MQVIDPGTSDGPARDVPVRDGPVRDGPVRDGPVRDATLGVDDAALLDALRDVVGAAHVLVGADVGARATHFWNPAPLVARALVRPATTAETSAVLALCHAARRSVVTHGGVTGLVDGDRATADDVILSLERMREVEALDPVGRTLSVGGGCTLERVQREAEAAGLLFGLDLGARGSCTIGGNIATNAGGLSVLRHGMMREQVLGLEAVLADGTVLSSMNRMLKNNAGYDLKQLFIGSEGTLGVVTRAVLRLRAATPGVHTALVAFERFEQVTALLAHADAALGGTLNAFEVLWNRFYRLNTDPANAAGVAAPLERDHPIYAILEARGADAARVGAAFEPMLADAFERGLVVDAVVPQSERERAAIWSIRETIEPALAATPVFVYDVSLPIATMEGYLAALETTLRARWPDVRLLAYGHLADGNLHLIVTPRPPSEGAAFDTGASGTDPDARADVGRRGAAAAPAPTTVAAWHAESDHLVYAPLEALGGSVSAEHGIGLAKKAHLARSRSAEEIALMRALKSLLDPHGILNPGKIV